MVHTPIEVMEVIQRMPELEDQALCSVLYLTAARINEIVRDFKGTQIQERQQERDGRVYDFIDFVNVLTLKKRKNRPLDYYRRTIPVIVDKYTEPFFDILNAYIETSMADKPDEAILFRKTSRAYQWHIEKYCKPYFAHWFRAARNTHLISIYNFNTYRLLKWNNWSNSRHADVYVNLSGQDLIDKQIS